MIMKQYILIFCCFILLLSQSVYGDNIVIADKQTKEPVESALVSIWTRNSDKPSQLYTTATGYVELPDSVIRITVNKFGYEKKDIKNKTFFEGDTLFLELGYVLREVHVSAIRHFFRVKSDRYIYDVDSDSTLIGRSTLDALSKIPILNVTINGDVSSMEGKNITYKVNGITDPLITGNLQAALRLLKAKYVKRIEMRNNPTGNDPNTLEINIVTKGRLEGYMAHAATFLNDDSWHTSLWGLTKMNKFSISGSYYYMRNRGHDEHSYVNEIRNNSDNLISITKDSKKSGYKAHFNNVEVSMSYDVDDQTIISAYGRVLAKVNPYLSSDAATLIQSNDSHVLTKYNQSSCTSFDDKEYSANLYFEKLYGKNAEDGKLFIGYDFYKRPNNSYTDYNYDVELCNDSSLLPKLEQYTRNEFVGLTMHTAMTEFRRHFMNYHTIFANATYRFRSDIDSDRLGDNIERTELHQHLMEGSVSYQYAVDKFSIHSGVGFRLYHDKIENSKYGPSYSFSRHHLIWQPTITMTYVPNYKRRYELSYIMTSLIPSIYAMNPFVFQDEPTHISYGNPLISPEKSQKFVLGANYRFNKAYWGISLSGQYTSDVILQYSFLDNRNVLNTTYNNIANKWDLGVSSFLTWNISRKTMLRTNFSLNYIDYTSHKLKNGNSGVQFSGRLNLTQELPFGIYGEFRGNYNTPWINFQGKGGENYSYGISLIRSFLSDKLRISLNADNMIPTYYSRTYTTEGEGYNQIQRHRRFHARYSFSLSYSFGNIRARVKSTKSSISNKDIKNSYDE